MLPTAAVVKIDHHNIDDLGFERGLRVVPGVVPNELTSALVLDVVEWKGSFFAESVNAASQWVRAVAGGLDEDLRKQGYALIHTRGQAAQRSYSV